MTRDARMAAEGTIVTQCHNTDEFIGVC